MIRDALDSFPLAPLYIAGFGLTWWKGSLQAYSELMYALAVSALALLAAYKIWQAYREKSGVEGVLKATATAAATAAKIRFGYIGAVAAALIALLAFGAWLLTYKRDQAVIAAAVAPAVVARRKKAKDDAGEDGIEDAPSADPSWPEWYQLAHGELGTKEAPGKRDNPRVVKYYADAGHPGIKHDETAWCAAFVGAMLERADVPCTKSLMASSYDKWGDDAKASPRIGDVVRLWRDSPKSIWGHVGFYAGETRTHVLLLGGNQGDAVTVARFPKSRIVTIRRPRSVLKSQTVAAGAAAAASGVGTIGTGAVALTQVLDEAPAAVETLNVTGDKVAGPLLQTGEPRYVKLALCIIIGCAVLTVLAGCYAMWRRAQDKKLRGH